MQTNLSSDLEEQNDHSKYQPARFLKLAGISGAAVLLSDIRVGYWKHALDRMQMEPFVPDAEIDLTAKEKWVQILPGEKTRVWGYEGKLLSGTGVTVDAVPGSYLGPILRVQSGTKLRILFHNNLAEKSVLHPHGLRVPEDCDGQPMQAIDPGRPKSTNSR